MGSYISIIAEVKSNNRMEFKRIAKSLGHKIAKDYGMSTPQRIKYVFKTETIIFETKKLGYAEPLELYERTRALVIDIWYIDIANAVKLTHIGRNARIKAYSCKKEFEEGLI